MGPGGVVLMLKGPLKCSQVDISGAIVDFQRKLIVSSV